MSYIISRQCCNWTFNYDTLQGHRIVANSKAIKEFMLSNVNKNESMTDLQNKLLTVDEERVCIRSYLRVLKSLISNFRPPLPNYVVISAFQFVKRFYVHASVMDFHPKEMMLVCLYIACKSEEFYLSIDHFVDNLPQQNREKYSNLIINSELFMVQRLQYDLAVYNSLGPSRGLLLTFCNFLMQQSPTTLHSPVDQAQLTSAQKNFNALYGPLQNILMDWYLTDMPLHSSPAQMALAGLYHIVEQMDQQKSASAVDNNSTSSQQPTSWIRYLENFMLHELCTGDSTQHRELLDKVKNLLRRVDEELRLPGIQMRDLEAKLSACRNPLYDIDSEAYQMRSQMHSASSQAFGGF